MLLGLEIFGLDFTLIITEKNHIYRLLIILALPPSHLWVKGGFSPVGTR